MSRGGAEREGDTESEAGSRIWAVSTERDVGLKLTNCEIVTRAEIKSPAFNDWATQAPRANKINDGLDVGVTEEQSRPLLGYVTCQKLPG